MTRDRLAVESILSDAKRGKVRAETFGPSGWYVVYTNFLDDFNSTPYTLCRQKCRIPRTNKRFLNSLVGEVVSTNKRMKIQQLRRETQWGDVGGAANGRKKSQKVREPPARKGDPTAGHGIREEQKGPSPGETSSSSTSSDKEEDSDRG